MSNILNHFKKLRKIGKIKLIQRFLISALVISIAWALGYNIEVKAEALDSDVVTFEDANLEAVVRSKLVKPSGNITVGDMKSMTGILDGYGKNISSLKGLEYATGINSLIMGNNKISHVTPLENMVNLVTLSLFNNEIKDISPLKDMTKLNYLYLQGNQLEDINPLMSVKELADLCLDDNNIRDITVLKNITKLKELSLSNNQIEDITPLMSMIELSNLYLNENNINDISPLKNMTNLTWLVLDDNQIYNITSLNNMPNLILLSLSHNYITDITNFNNKPNLEALYLSNNQIRDISSLNQISKLIRLDLSTYEISDITALENMANLSDLILKDNVISSIPNGIGNLTNLEYLDMRNNKLSGQLPESLNNLVNLKYWDDDPDPDTAYYTSFAGNQLTGTVPSELKSTINNDEAFKNNIFEGESNQKQLVLKQPTNELNLSLGEVPNQNALQSLVELTDGANKSNPLYELELVPIDNTIIDPVTNKTLKPGTTTAYIKLKGISNTNSYGKTLFPITINISDKLGSNKEINVSFLLQESLEITMDDTAINFGQVSSNGGEKQNTNFKVTSSLPYSISFMGVNNFIGTNDNSHVIPIEKLSLKLDTLESKTFSLSKVSYISNGVAGIDKNHTLEFIMGNTLGYVSDSYSTQVQIVVENL